MNSFGRVLRVSVFGESHGQGVGALLDGVPPQTVVDGADIAVAMALRRPGQSSLVTQRQEPDAVEILSGVLDGRATGAPIAVWIRNVDIEGRAYEKSHVARPGHADATQWAWSGGVADLRGGGHASGRLTAPLVAAGVVAQQVLGASVVVGAHLHQVGEIVGPTGQHTAKQMSDAASRSATRTAHRDLEPAFVARIEAARKAQDSVGAAVEFAIDGLPAGVGDPFWDGLESTLAHALFAIPAVKGVEFGKGFAAAGMAGSAHNDPLLPQQPEKPGTWRTNKNNSGGILGGRSTGDTVRGRVAVKPTSSIARPQDTVDLGTGQATSVKVGGRHDPCIGIRAVPVVQAVLRLALADQLLISRAAHGGTRP